MAKRTIKSIDEYLDLLQRSGIVEKDRVAQLVAEFDKLPAGKVGDSIVLAKRLQDEHLVTPWQNRHLLEGRAKGFFLGRYKLLDYLGTGGMSTVYLAEHALLRRRVAIKVMLEGQVDKTALERFHRECQAIARLDHPNIVRAHDFDSDGKFHFLVMEFVDGPNLQTLVGKDGPLSVHLAAEYCRQAALGLASAHAAGMVHRDIKPSNLLRDPKGVVKLLDLGVARLTGFDSSLTLASNQNLLGTIDYLSPEQALSSHHVDGRSDIYSLGCTLYFLLTGHPPFPDGSQAQKLLAHQIQAPAPLTKKRRDVPPDFVAFLDQMMAKRPNKRPQTMQEVAESLKMWASVKAPAPAPAPKPAAPVVQDQSVLESSQVSRSSLNDTHSNTAKPTVVASAALIRVVCDGCKTRFGAPKEAINRRVKCPKCGHPIVITATAPLVPNPALAAPVAAASVTGASVVGGQVAMTSAPVGSSASGAEATSKPTPK